MAPVPPVVYTISDGNGGTASASLLLGPVTPQNDAPIAANDSFPVVEDTPVSGNVLANDTDPDGDPLAVSGFTVGGQSYLPGQTATIPGVGTIVIASNGVFNFIPAPNYNGPVPVITYTVSDDDGATDTATLTLGPVSAVNDAPVANTDQATGKGGDTIRIPVLSNDRDVDGDPLQIVAINGRPVTVGVPVSIANGTITVNSDGTVSFTPDIGYSGPVQFSYTISDGNGGFDTASVSVDVQAGYLEIDPPFVPPHLPNDLPPLLTADGMVVDSIGDLNGTYLSVDGMIDGVANSIRYLNGISGLSADGPISQVVHQIDRWLSAEDRLAGVEHPLFRGGSALTDPDGRDGTWFMVSTIMREGVLQLTILTADGERGAEIASGHTVTLADGRALPSWVEMDRGGMLIGHPPAGQAFIDLKIQAMDKDNRVIVDNVRIDLTTGVVATHTSDQRTDAGPLLFSDQTTAGIEMSIERANSLAAALTGWTELRDDTRAAS
ncbi:MAG: Ig-like domain-containing protein [Mesorhizobium sp.]